MSAPLFANLEESRAFERRLATRALGKHIVFHPRTQSTNDLALAAARGDGRHGTVFVADAQEAGRGRRGRSWECPPGMGLLFSVLIRPVSIPPEATGWVPLAAGLACAEALAALAPELNAVTVKWPNDVVLPHRAAPGWKKIGGILCESSLAASGPLSAANYFVIGIGLNVNQAPEFLPEATRAPSTSARAETKREWDRAELLQAVLLCLESSLDKLNDVGSRAEIRESVENRLRAWLPTWKMITFHSPPGADIARKGIFAGLDEFGRIRIGEANGETALTDAEIVSVA